MPCWPRAAFTAATSLDARGIRRLRDVFFSNLSSFRNRASFSSRRMSRVSAVWLGVGQRLMKG
jgi:hypothetical protein